VVGHQLGEVASDGGVVNLVEFGERKLVLVQSGHESVEGVRVGFKSANSSGLLNTRFLQDSERSVHAEHGFDVMEFLQGYSPLHLVIEFGNQKGFV
jgi:hypothetical protein